jgi:hypothetical protein
MEMAMMPAPPVYLRLRLYPENMWKYLWKYGEAVEKLLWPSPFRKGNDFFF